MSVDAPSQGAAADGGPEWSALVEAVRAGRVVPVVGRDLLFIKDAETGLRVPYHRHLAGRLAKKMGIDPAQLGAAPAIEDVVSRCSGTAHELDRPYIEIAALLQEDQAQWDDAGPPEEIGWLASIPSFDLFVCITIDDLVERAVRNSRPHADVRVLACSKRRSDTREGRDLPPDWRGRGADPAGPSADRRVFVHQLFGRCRVGERRGTEKQGDRLAGDFAISDEDRLEVVHTLEAQLADGGSMQNLGKVLRERSLLFLGCGYPDWLLRFFLRAVRGRPFSQGAPEPVRVAENDLGDPSLVLFLKRNGAATFQLPPRDFVQRLARDCSSPSVPVSSAPAVAPRPLVVLSCPEAQKAQADAVADELRGFSIDATVVPVGQAHQVLSGAAGYMVFLTTESLQSPEGKGEWTVVERWYKRLPPPKLLTVALSPDADTKLESMASLTWPRAPSTGRTKVRKTTPRGRALAVARSLIEAERLRIPVPVSLYISVSPDEGDQKLAQEIVSRLRQTKWLTAELRSDDLVGSDEDQARRAMIERAHVLVLLLSSDLLNDDPEMAAVAGPPDGEPPPRRRILLLARQCSWEEDTRLANDPLLNDSLSQRTAMADRPDRDAAWSEAVEALQCAVLKLLTERQDR